MVAAWEAVKVSPFCVLYTPGPNPPPPHPLWMGILLPGQIESWIKSRAPCMLGTRFRTWFRPGNLSSPSFHGWQILRAAPNVMSITQALSSEMATEVWKWQPHQLLSRDLDLYGPNSCIRSLPAMPNLDLSAPLHPNPVSGFGVLGPTSNSNKKKCKQCTFTVCNACISLATPQGILWLFVDTELLW